MGRLPSLTLSRRLQFYIDDNVFMELGEKRDNPPIGGDYPLEAAASYYHPQPAAVMGDPGVSDHGTRLEVERIEG